MTAADIATNTPAIARTFLGWDRPLLGSAVEQLRVRFAQGKSWDMTDMIVVLPVHRAASRLADLLRVSAAELDLRLALPKLVTVGSLPELLYVPERPLASELQQTLAWTRALTTASDAAIEPLMPTVPPRDPIAPWVEMASTLRRLCEDLAADAIAPDEVVERVQGDGERARWRLIASLHQQYLDTLRRSGLADPYDQRRAALADERCAVSVPVQLIACVDLGMRTCLMLDAIASHVTLMIGAPEDQSRMFDPWGRVLPAQWREAHVEIAEEDLIPAGDAEHQASAAAALVDRWRREPEFERVTVGITDDSFAPLVETELILAGVQPSRVAGLPVARTAPGRLLELVRDCSAAPTWLAFSALIRHSTVLTAMAAEHSSLEVLTQLDQLRNNHFPVRLDEPLPPAAVSSNSYGALLDTQSRVMRWLEPMLGPPARFSQWCVRLRALLDSVYAATARKVPAEVAAAHHAAVEELDVMLARFAELTNRLDVSVSAHAAIDMVLQRLADPRSSIGGERSSVEIAGWLDLALDDAPAMVVVGFNHPYVPQAVTADPFLPGTLRSRLRAADNERRFARDAYVLQVIQKARPAKAMIVGRAGPDGSPTPPSRLLSACPSTVTLGRVRHLLDPPARDAADQGVSHVIAQYRNRWHRDTARTDLPVPMPATTRTLEAISVTAFRDYLACPFRFYLRHVLGLRPLDDAAGELAANQFGDLIHAAVEAYGRCDDKDLTAHDAIAERLLYHLNDYAARQYGSHPTAAVRVQIAQAEKRLLTVAQRQAERVGAGWRIHVAEAAVTPSDGAAIELADGRKLVLKGRVDRIDYQPSTGRWAILDYKTHGHHPMAKHYDSTNERWIDLQLPLYLKMLAALGIDAPVDQVDVGYFNIASKAEETGIHLAEFTPALLRSAFDRAEEVARGVLDARFEADPDAPAVDYDDYAAILQTGVAQNLLDDLEDLTSE